MPEVKQKLIDVQKWIKKTKDNLFKVRFTLEDESLHATALAGFKVGGTGSLVLYADYDIKNNNPTVGAEFEIIF